jgi:hypothetical protein
MCCACHVIGAPRRRRRYAFQLLVPFLWLYHLGGREMRAVARAAARRACAGDASAARLLSASAASLQSSAAPPRDAPANLELHRWAEGLKYGVPKFSGLATFFRQPFSPTLEGARPAAHAQRAAPMRSRLPAPRGARYHCPCGASLCAVSAAALRCCRRRNPFLCTACSPGLDVALVGIPYDAGANHPGTRLGPREIRNKSSTVRR